MSRSNSTRLLFLGHDMKFITEIVNHFSALSHYGVETYQYTGHKIVDPERLKSILGNYDIIFCEWGLNNLEWMSHNKLPEQKLITRIHLQEFRTDYLEKTRWDNVDSAIFISQFQLDRFIAKFPEMKSRSRLIYNYVKCDELEKIKDKSASFRLGQLGILPMRKSPHLAVEILKLLNSKEDRFSLSFKSKRPEELSWLWQIKEEQDYYNQLYSDIDHYGLSSQVNFEPHDNKVAQWFATIGFLLSTSDFEGSHQAVAEAMASGTIPIVRNWDGADTLYPEKFIYSEIPEAIERIESFIDSDLFQEESNFCKQYARGNFDLKVIALAYENLFSEIINR